jgi:hypothetical protein
MVEATINTDNRTDEPIKPGSDGAINELSRRDQEPPRIAGFAVESPAEFGGEFATIGDAPKRRGRKPGSKNRASIPTEKPPQSNLIESFESLLLSVHFMASKLLDAPEWELDPPEAKALSDSLKRIAEFYPVGLSPKRIAQAELAVVVATVYGPRIVTSFKKAPKPQQPGPRAVPPPQRQAQQPQAQQQQTQPQARAANGPRVPSEMWNQDGQENPSDQA